MERITITCPVCSNSFDVSNSITEIACNFCGAVFNLSSIKDDNLRIEELEMDSMFYLNKAVTALTPDVTTLLQASKAVTKKNYSQSFNDYYNKICESFKYFDKAFGLCTGNNKELVLEYAKEFAEKIKKNAGKENFNSLKGSDLDNVIYLYIAFAVPSILKFEAKYSDDLAETLLQTWNDEHKNRKIGKSTFEAINQGFKHKLCFITTAVCNTLGRPDDCRELNSFRNFRDDYLLKQPDGRAQVREYYLIAPLIVNAIDASPEKERVYHDIWNNHLSKCFKMYEQHEYEQCRKNYTEMVSILRNYWL
jgi:hypothetical protein